MADNSTSSTGEDQREISSELSTVNKFNWLKHAKANRDRKFVKARPSLTRESSTADLVSRENSSSDFFQNSRLNLFDTAPKPEQRNYVSKVCSIICRNINKFIF